MTAQQPTKPHLVPEEGIEINDGRTVASTRSPWFRIEPVADLVRHKWVRLRYSSSFFDEPVRPLIRFVTKKSDAVIQPMNGPFSVQRNGSAEFPMARQPFPLARRHDRDGSIFGLMA